MERGGLIAGHEHIRGQSPDGKAQRRSAFSVHSVVERKASSPSPLNRIHQLRVESPNLVGFKCPLNSPSCNAAVILERAVPFGWTGRFWRATFTPWALIVHE